MSLNSTEENLDFDIEAQQSLLQTPTPVKSDEPRNHDARQTWARMLLLIRSALFFQLASTSSPHHYSALTHDDRLLINQDSEAVAGFGTTQDLGSDSEISEQQQDIQKETIAEIVREKKFQEFCLLGIHGVADALGTNLEKGLQNLDQTNDQACKPSRLSQLLMAMIRLYHSFLGACNNWTVGILFIAGILSLVFGIKEEGKHDIGWLNGVVVLFSMFVLVFCKTIQNFLSERSRLKLDLDDSSRNSTARKMNVRVIRNGLHYSVAATELRVGDLVSLQRGDQVPADGIAVFLNQNEEALEIDEGLKIRPTIHIDEENPFLFYGATVIHGRGRMIVTSVAMDTVWGEMMKQSMESPDKKCKFETCLHSVNSCIHFMGLLISILICIVLFLHYKSGKLDDEYGFKPELKEEPSRMKAIVDAFEGILTGSKGTAKVLTALLSVSLVGLMEGIPFVVSLAILIWNRTALADKATERDYLACIKTASVTTICTDAFGELIEGEREIKFYVGGHFVTEISVVNGNVLELLCDGIGTLPFQSLDLEDFELKVKPLLWWAEAKLGMKKECVSPDQCTMTTYQRCNPFLECCSVIVKKNGHNDGAQTMYYHCMGPPHSVLVSCSHYYDIKGTIQVMNDEKRELFEEAVRDMGIVIAYACREVDHEGFIFLGLISLKDTEAEDTRRAVSTLFGSGIKIVLVSGGDTQVVKRMGVKCGLLSQGPEDDPDQVVDACDFRMEKIDEIRVMGKCVPSDKINLIKLLKERGEVVALIAQRTVDAPALRHADIGIAMETSAVSEEAAECSEIVIWKNGAGLSFMDHVILKARCFHNNVRKFLQLQLIVAISSLLINFIGIVFVGDAPITAVQLFCLNLMVSFIGGLALLTAPDRTTQWSAKLITKSLWRNIAIQALYQALVFVTLHNKGQEILGISGGLVKAMVYNGFVVCQLFNLFIARETERRNIFRGLIREHNWFWLSVVLFIVCQGVMVAIEESFIGGRSSWELNWKLWSLCFLIGIVCWVLDWMGKTMSIIIASFIAVLINCLTFEFQLTLDA